MKEILKLSLSLGLTCLIAGSILVYANTKTAAAVNAAKSRDKQAALSLVLGTCANDPIKDAKTFGKVTFYPARDAAGALVALAGEAEPVSHKGFGGTLKVLVALDPQGKIRSVVVTEHKETPGLGTNVTDRKRTRSLWSLFGGAKEQAVTGLPPNIYLDRYADQAASEIGAAGFTILGRAPTDGENGIQAITGATISSRAVGDAVHQVCAAFTENQTALLNETETQQ